MPGVRCKAPATTPSAAGVTINGLPILTIEPDLDQHYQNDVIGGEGAFMIMVKTDTDFADAILKKLIAEIAMNERLDQVFVDRNSYA